MGFKNFCGKNVDDNYHQQVKDLQNLYEKYKDRSEDELYNELLNSINNQKTNGTFNYSNLLMIYDKISPFLNDTQKQKMKDILEKIK